MYHIYKIVFHQQESELHICVKYKGYIYKKKIISYRLDFEEVALRFWASFKFEVIKGQHCNPSNASKQCVIDALTL